MHERFLSALEFRQHKLEAMLRDPKSPVNVQCLLDLIIAFMMDLDTMDLTENSNLSIFLERYKKAIPRIRELMMKPSDFEVQKVICSGDFGEVQLVRHTESCRSYAMKVINKNSMKTDSTWILTERNFMALAKSPWLVQLHYAFQDPQNLYMVMDYMPGGDLATVLYKGKLSEEVTKFYAAELALAVDVIHSMKYIHCDIKPSNILFDARGHLKLSDFSLCVKMGVESQVHIIGTPGISAYMAPEVFQERKDTNLCGKEIDWWSVGICVYEMLVGRVPFRHDSKSKTKTKSIFHIKKTIRFPDELSISAEAKDFISALLKDRYHRLGRDGISEIKQHSWFKNKLWTFNTIQKIRAPTLLKMTDLDTFSLHTVTQNEAEVEGVPKSKYFEGKNLLFVGFSYLKQNRLLLETPTQKQEDVLQQKLKIMEEQLRKEKKNRVNAINLQEKYRTVNKQLEIITKQLEAERAMSARLKKKDEEKGRLLYQAQASQRTMKERRMEVEKRMQARLDADRQEKLKLSKALVTMQAQQSVLEIQVKKKRDTLVRRVTELQKENDQIKSDMASRIRELELMLDQEIEAKTALLNQLSWSHHISKDSKQVRFSRLTYTVQQNAQEDKTEKILTEEKVPKTQEKLQEEEKPAAHEVTKSPPTKKKTQESKEDVRQGTKPVHRKRPVITGNVQHPGTRGAQDVTTASDTEGGPGSSRRFYNLCQKLKQEKDKKENINSCVI